MYFYLFHKRLSSNSKDAVLRIRRMKAVELSIERRKSASSIRDREWQRAAHATRVSFCRWQIGDIVHDGYSNEQNNIGKEKFT